MAMLLYATRAYAAESYPPPDILSKLSGLLSMEHSGHFATALLILLDLEEGTITVVNGGHPPPLLLRDHEGDYVHTESGLPVGVSPDPTYTPVTLPISPGTTLLAFTDGLIERRGETLDVGLARLRQAATTGGNGSLDTLLSHLVASQVGHGADDDTVLLGVRWRG
jgi:serine phosphatase RsbU (regulator of sigma subunit)